MLSTALEQAIDRAYHSAQGANHEFLTLEHLLLALLEDRSVTDALHSFGADLAELREQLNRYLSEHCPQFPAGQSDRATQPTTAFQRMIQRAVLHARNWQKRSELPQCAGCHHQRARQLRRLLPAPTRNPAP